MAVDIIGQSPGMAEVRELVEKVAPLDLQVLITGETGTGKDLIARMIHEKSPRRKGPFVPVNCGAIPDTLVESCLFGHERGAFTGATSRSRGFFEEAYGGTLFLDEISEGSAALQTALLRVLQEECFFRVGSTRQQRADVRIVAATNRDLKLCVDVGTFREDLFFRLNVFEIRVPPLRDRGDDIFLLTEYYLKRLNRKYGRGVRGLSPEVEALFRTYHWPGNVRELLHVIERAVVVEPGPSLTPASLPRYLQNGNWHGPEGADNLSGSRVVRKEEQRADRLQPAHAPEPPPKAVDKAKKRIDNLIGTRNAGNGEQEIVPARDPDTSVPSTPQHTLPGSELFSMPISEARRRFEREYIIRLLERTKGNMSLAAEIAGIRRQNLYRKVQQLDIDPARFRPHSGTESHGHDSE
jgi:DNA-binding NtrC family response regulator